MHHRRRRPRRAAVGKLSSREAALFALCRPEFPDAGRCSATLISTPRSRWTPAPSVRGSGPRDAYRFAKGEEIMASAGQPAKLSRPLDFLVVADHSDNMGFFPDLLAGKPELLADPTGRKWYDMIQNGQGAEAALEIITAFARASSSGRSSICRTSAPTGPPGRRPSRPPRKPTTRPLHRLHRLRMDVEHRRQQPPPQRHLPRQRRQGPPGRALTPCCRRAATIRATCGNGWRPTRRRPAATCWRSPTTATSPTAACSR